MKDPIAALNFLQTNVSEAVNHNDSLEEQQFQNLVTNLFSDEAEKLGIIITFYVPYMYL